MGIKYYEIDNYEADDIIGTIAKSCDLEKEYKEISFDDIEEERRVLYVALTRAQNELILTKQNFNLWARDTVDEQGRKLDSYFLNDLTRQLCAMETHHRTRQQTVKSALVERQAINLDFGIDLD